MKSSLFPPFLIAALALNGGAACAEKADRDKPMNVESDSLRYDDLKQTSVFSGRVVLTKGSILIRGAKINVRQDADGHQYAVVSAKPQALDAVAPAAKDNKPPTPAAVLRSTTTLGEEKK